MRRVPPWIRSYLQMAAAAALVGFGVSSLIVPARLADGGLVGVAIALHYLTHLGVGPLYAAMNVPLLVWAWRCQGLRFVWRTGVGVALLSLASTAFAPLRIALPSTLLAALYGGLCVGAGIGMMLRVGGSTGGTDILARHLYRSRGISYSHTYLASDVVVLGTIAIWVGLPAAMYAWITTNVAGRVVSYVVEGARRGRLALIITERATAVSQRVSHELARGATRLRGHGTWTGEERLLLLVAVADRQVVRLRTIVAEVDPRAFVVVLPATEVFGEGFFTLGGEGQA